MNIEEFFELPEDAREYLLELHNKRKYIRDMRAMLDRDIQKHKTREFNLQQECTHPHPDKRHSLNEDEYGKRTGGGRTHYYCPDCYYRWTDEH
jgi:transposase-like protein